MRRTASVGCFLIIAITAGFAIAREIPTRDTEDWSALDYHRYLIRSLKDDNVGIRTSAATLLGEKKVLAGTKPLILMLEKDKEYAARIVAGLALMRIGDTEALQALQRQAKKDKNETVRHVLAGAVAELTKDELVKL